MDIFDFKKFYFLGIGGVSMSGFALLIKDMGFEVSGYDLNNSSNTDVLEKNGIEIFYKPDVEHILNNIDCVVYSSAISDDFLELKEARKRGIRCVSRGEMIGDVLKRYKKPICVSGTHGKTTTTALISTIFLDANLNPTISVGGHLPKIDGVFKKGDNNFFILESCEYKNNFLNFEPSTALIMNIEMDHSDFFKDLGEIYKSFNKFAKKASEKVIINSDIIDYENVLIDVNTTIVTYSIFKEESNYNIKNLEYLATGTSFDLYKDGKYLDSFNSNLLGENNLYNTLAALVVALENGISIKDSKIGLQNFTGINRRFQLKGIKNKVVVYDDYAHHPTACKKTLETFSNIAKGNIYCVFQPHTFSRTISLFDDFAKSFSEVTKVLLLDIYPAREIDTGVVNSKMLIDKINEYSNNGLYFSKREECLDYLKNVTDRDDIVVTLGAGDVYQIGEEFLKE